jgi:hypothetical protein
VGSFAVLRFRSDFSLRANTHNAQFVGTAAVWSHAACEKSSLPGMRIFIHPTAEQGLEEEQRARSQLGLYVHQLIPLADGETSKHVACELNYLSRSKTLQWSDVALWRNVQVMRLQAVKEGAPPRALGHYDATFEAINRMRATKNMAPFHPEDHLVRPPRPLDAGLRQRMAEDHMRWLDQYHREQTKDST